MEFSLPSWRRVVRFLAVFYAGGYALITAYLLGIGILFDPTALFAQLWKAVRLPLFWPLFFYINPVEIGAVIASFAFALAEPRVTEVIRR